MGKGDTAEKVGPTRPCVKCGSIAARVALCTRRWNPFLSVTRQSSVRSRISTDSNGSGWAKRSAGRPSSATGACRPYGSGRQRSRVCTRRNDRAPMVDP